MLKWTKLYCRKDDVTRNSNREIDKDCRQSKESDNVVKLSTISLSNEHSTQHIEPQLCHTFFCTTQCQTKSEAVQIRWSPKIELSLREEFNLAANVNSSVTKPLSSRIQPSSAIPNVNSRAVNDAVLKTSLNEIVAVADTGEEAKSLTIRSSQSQTAEEEVKRSAIELSQSQTATEENARRLATKSLQSQAPVRDKNYTMSFLSSSSSDKALSPHSTSTEPQSNPALTAHKTDIAQNYENETSIASNLTSPEKRKSSNTALPDIARSVPNTERTILGPIVEWNLENISMEELAKMNNFPCVCLFEEHVEEKHGQRCFLSPGLKIYSHQPVLFQIKTRKKQARARTIFKDPKGAYYEVGQTMIIPDDYQGWFEIVPSDFRRTACFLSIDSLAKAMPRKFFTRSNIKGIRIEGEGEQQKYLERKIGAGSVLETKGTFTAKWKTRAETGTFKKKTVEWELQEVTYLKCLDSDQQEILIPMTHKGKFNAIYERGRTENAVYSMKDILSDLTLPVKVRLLFGKAPVVPCIFTGMLVVRSAAVDETIVGSTILNTRNVLFEISADAPVKVKYTSKDDLFIEMPTYKDAQRLCNKYANLFSTMIKLSADMDTDQKVIMHVPSDPSVVRQVDESLRALDLITDISFTSKPEDHLLDSLEKGSTNSDDQMVMPREGTLERLEEFKSRESHTFV